MKDGFYLSLDGLTIIEIRLQNFHKSGVVRSLYRRKYEEDLLPRDAIQRLFKCWIYLK